MSEEYPFHLMTRRPAAYGFGGLDRSAHLREGADWLESLLGRAGTRLVPVWRLRSLVHADPGGDLRAVRLDVSSHASLVARAETVAFLGEKDGVAHIGIDMSGLGEEQSAAMFSGHGEFADLRAVGPLLGRFDGSLLAYARGLMYWHQRHRHCGVCGSPTRSVKGGHQRDCTDPACGAPTFPRTDPAVIMLVHDGERALLGRQRVWKPGMYSTLAGFVEPGETLEEAVAREVREETDIEVEDVRYHSSQPWPFPASIMLGFEARARTTRIRRNDDEVEDARWFTSDELSRFHEFGNSLPRPDSIARRLIDDWLAGLA